MEQKLTLEHMITIGEPILVSQEPESTLAPELLIVQPKDHTGRNRWIARSILIPTVTLIGLSLILTATASRQSLTTPPPPNIIVTDASRTFNLWAGVLEFSQRLAEISENSDLTILTQGKPVVLGNVGFLLTNPDVIIALDKKSFSNWNSNNRQPDKTVSFTLTSQEGNNQLTSNIPIKMNLDHYFKTLNRGQNVSELYQDISRQLSAEIMAMVDMAQDSTNGILSINDSGEVLFTGAYQTKIDHWKMALFTGQIPTLLQVVSARSGAVSKSSFPQIRY